MGLNYKRVLILYFSRIKYMLDPAMSINYMVYIVLEFLMIKKNIDDRCLLCWNFVSHGVACDQFLVFLLYIFK